MRLALFSLCFVLWTAASQAQGGEGPRVTGMDPPSAVSRTVRQENGEIHQTFGLFIGSTAYHGADKLRPLEYADDDVLRFSRAMRPVMRWDKTILLVNPDPDVRLGLTSEGFSDYQPATRASVLEALDTLEGEIRAFHASNPGKGVRLLLYISAHGDSQGVHLEDGILTGGALQARLQQSTADAVVLVADSCFSDAWLGLKGAVVPGAALPTAPLAFPLDMVAQVVKDLERVGAVTASSYTREERTLVRGGLVTHIIASAMLGAADLDQDGRILYDELQAFLNVYARNTGIIEGIRVRAPRKARTQPPTLLDLNQLPQRGLIFPPEPGGAHNDVQCFWVRSEKSGAASSPRTQTSPERVGEGGFSLNGSLVAEFCRTQDAVRRLYLPAGAYRVQTRRLSDGHWGREGRMVVGEGFTPVLDARLPERWVLSAMKGEDLKRPALSESDARAMASARSLSEEEAGYLDTTPFHQVVPLSARSDAHQWSVKALTGLPLLPVGGQALLGNPETAFTQEHPAVGLGFGYDFWWAALGRGYGVLGLELGALGAGNTQVGESSGVSVGMLAFRARVGWLQPRGPLELKAFAWAGTLSATTLSSVTEDGTRLSLALAPRAGLELEVGYRLPRSRRLVFSLGPQTVLEPHRLGDAVVWQPWLGLSGAAGMAW